MRVVLRYLFRVLIGLLILHVVVAGLTIYMRTDSFDHLLKREVILALHGRFCGQLAIGSIQTPRLGMADLSDLTSPTRAANCSIYHLRVPATP
jgi:hypothetical protein